MTSAQEVSALSSVAAEPPAPSRRRRQRRPRVDRGEQRYVLIGLILFALYSVAPVWWLLVNFTKNRQDLYNTNGLWFAEMNVGTNLEQLLSYNDHLFLRWMLNTIFYSVVGAGVCVIISLAAGYSLSKYNFRGRSFGLAVVIGSFLVPSALITLPLFLLFSSIGLVDTIWAVLIPSFVSPFGVYLAKVYVDASIPDEILEAARIDGASEPRIFGQIVVRLMRTGAATIFVLLFVGNWNSFFLPLTMLRGSEKWTLALGLYNWFSSRNAGIADNTTMTLTGAVLSIIPLAVVLVAMQRYWKTGVTMGALK